MERTPSGIYISTDAVRDREQPMFGCAICGRTFAKFESGLYQKHVAQCANDHEAELRAMSTREAMPGLFGDESRSDLEIWVAENRDALIEGRKKM